jgi:rifampicin phosphotransferase
MQFGAAKYGLLIAGFDVAIVNGFWYQRLLPFGLPEGASRAPSARATWLATRLHPSLIGRIRTGRRAFAEKSWRADLARWDRVDKPQALAGHRALLAIEPQRLGDDELLEHLRACDTHLEQMTYLHQKYTVACFAPVGDLLAQVRVWTGREPSDVLGATRGCSAVSLGFAVSELEDLAASIRAHLDARTVLADQRDEEHTLQALLGLKCAAGDAARRFVDAVKYRSIGYDVGEPLVGEVPEVVVRCIRATVEGHFRPRPDDAGEWAGRVGEAIPEKHRTEFGELLAEARAISRLRDERGMYSDCFAIGIARRALLEAGERLVCRGYLHERAHAVDLTLLELKALFADHAVPSASVVQERVNWRTTMTASECPPRLGPPAAEPPDPALLPKPARRPARAVAAVMSAVFGRSEAPSSFGAVRGLSVNRGVYEGVAKNVRGPAEFGKIRSGDVLVTCATAPYFNVILPLLGAIVTDRGGQLCHAAIVAREYGIPGVVGTLNATALIPDGARVRVDGTRAEVTVLSR